MVYGRKQTDIHTTSAHAVTLVWGSLRLAPIIIIDLYFLLNSFVVKVKYS